MVRRIPDTLMPHRAVLEPFLADRPDGWAWAAAADPVRCQWAPSSQDRVMVLDGTEYRVTGRLFLDDEPALRTKVSVLVGDSTRDGLWVLGTKLWDHPRVARFAEVTLTDAPMT